MGQFIYKLWCGELLNFQVKIRQEKCRSTIYYLRIGKFQTPNQFTALQQIDIQARPPPRCIPITLIRVLHDTRQGMLSEGNRSVDSTTTTNSSCSDTCQTTTEQTTTPPSPSPVVNDDPFRLPPDLLTEENESQMTAVLRHIVKMFKTHNKGIQFQYFNGKECALVSIPKIERGSYRNFKQHKYRNNKTHFMEQILEQIGADCGDVEE